MLEKFGESKKLKYSFSFAEADITFKHLKRLEYRHLRDLGMSVGDALDFLAVAAAVDGSEPKPIHDRVQ